MTTAGDIFNGVEESDKNTHSSDEIGNCSDRLDICSKKSYVHVFDKTN